MRKSSRVSIVAVLFALLCPLLFTGCPLFRATGNAVAAAGEGAGNIVGSAGRAVDNTIDAATAPLD